jgi:hypothetical protein
MEKIMSASVLVVLLALGPAQTEKAVTDAEKEEFLQLLSKLPTKGEFFTKDAVTKAEPYTRVLLALTEKDLEKRDLYPFLALSSGLAGRKEPRQYATTNFDKIAHPTMKLAWAAMLVRESPPSPEIVTFLRKALDSKEDAKRLSEMLGPEFEDFKERVIRIYDQGRKTNVELVKRHTVNAIPDFREGFSYSRDNYVVGPDQLVYAVRPFKQRGELITYNTAKKTTNRLTVPQPKDFKADDDVFGYFDDPVLSINSGGDLLCRWTIKGNGDHGLALLKKGSDSFLVRRVDLSLADCFIVAAPDGAWFLIQGGPRFTVYQVDQDLRLTRLGKFAGKGHHTIRIQDARFISKDILHLFWADVLPAGNYLRMRCVDFDVKKQKWLHNREVFQLDKFVSSASEPTVLQLNDDSLHYLWRIDEGAHQGDATGLYYQPETDGKTVKICNAYKYRAIAVGNLIVLCYTLKESPEKVFFRVINHGALGPVSEFTFAEGEKHNLDTEHMVLYAESDRIWFVNTFARNTLCELKLEDAKKP